MSASNRVQMAVLLATLTVIPALAQTGGADGTETVIVTASPLPGNGIDANRVAGEVDVLSVSDLTRDRPKDALPNAVATQLSSVAINNQQGSQFQPDFVYRGFEASAISGIAEGVGVYQNGVRLNESFGDNVNWDLIPEFAVDTLTLQSNNPVFGLNTLGGVITLDMKSGLTFDGVEAEVSGGSFGNLTGDVQYGTRFGNFAVYAGFGALADDGFRYQSQTNLRQGYGDLAYEDGPLTLHLSVAGSTNRLGAVGPTPVEMLATNPRAVFTLPQAMEDESELSQLRGTWKTNDAITISLNTYWRHFHQNLVDGNTTNVDFCENDTAWLCLGGDNEFPNDVLYDVSANPVPASILPNGATPGETDFTHTDTNTVGLAAQMAWVSAPGGRTNSLVVGASVDRGDTDYTAYGELGNLLGNLEVVGTGVVIDEARNPDASPPIETPVHVNGRNTYGGFYAVDVFDITPALAWTISGRLNTAAIELKDLRGTTLNSGHSFSHFNPGTGLAYRATPQLTAYAGYSESNRAPTAGELSCADPAAPCILDAFLVADPSLKQVTSRTYEIGLRGHFIASASSGQFTWNVSAYRTDAANDIRLLATDINGFGFFSNAGTTRHQGIDAGFEYHPARWKLRASYSYLGATFRDSLSLSSNSPGANDDGVIFVHPGDTIPLNPTHRLTISADIAMTEEWSIGADVRAQSSAYLSGDESNQEPKLPGFLTAGFRTAYMITNNFSFFGEMQNVFDKRYFTYGAFTELEGLPPNINLTNPRTYSPAPGRLFFAGLRATL